jgi:hypothetical protein
MLFPADHGTSSKRDHILGYKISLCKPKKIEIASFVTYQSTMEIKAKETIQYIQTHRN